MSTDINAINSLLERLLRIKLAHHLQVAKPTESFQNVANDMLQEIRKWLDLPDQPKDNNEFQEDLMNLMVRTASRHYAIKDIPIDQSEWNRLLAHWLRQNTFNNIIKDREIYYILAVDGFMGFQPNDLKKYLSNITNILRNTYRIHYRAVRNMYNWINSSNIACLTGTDSASVIFLAFLNLYEKRLSICNRDVLTHLNQVKIWTEGYLHQHSNYYKVIKEVNDKLLDQIGKVYLDHFLNEEDWKLIGKEQTDKLEYFAYK